MNRFVFALPVILIAASVYGQAGRGASVIDTPHNLSVSGPGGVHAVSEQRVCVFCHTPHAASPVQPLWNRFQPVNAYTVYSSSSLDAITGQPTGSSKLCLSCHDGTIALGSVLSQGQQIQMAGSLTTIPPGSTNLGTDLSDDHPVSFRYDTFLVSRDPKLRPPSGLPAEIRLDANQELQCTACHDAHDNSSGGFMVMSNTNSQLCTSCHQILSTTVTGHENCLGCHQVHTAPSGPFLMQGVNARATCLTCHDGSTSAPNIAADMSKSSVHDTDSSADPIDPIPDHVSCADCHEPHTMNTGQAAAPDVHPNFGQVSGVSLTGAEIDPAQFEYEVCFKCHDDQAAVTPWISRLAVQNNTRLEFSPSSVSFHPVVTTGRNSDVPSLKTGLTPASLIHCTDCHGSDNGASGVSGAHGSASRPLLVARYDTAEQTSESASAYALCYQCHERTSILNDDSFERHDKHVRGERIPCSACHDAHGINSAQGTTTNNSHLINFDSTVAFPSPKAGNVGPIFIDQGNRAGTCTLLCHGEDHDDENYGP